MSKKEKNQNIQVYVRCRPINSIEKKQCSPSVVEVVNNKDVIIKERFGDKEHSKKFSFDRVFGPEATQLDVYKTIVGNLIDEVLTGYNCTVFAYGQTGTGKTHTMQGLKSSENLSWEDDPQSGIIPRTLHHLFEALGELGLEYGVTVSFIELYNEELFDLLTPSNNLYKLKLFEDSVKKGSVVIQGLAETTVNSKDEVYAILDRGTERRRMASTLMNDTSSRSHTVFSVTVHIRENTLAGEDLMKIGKLNLVDLAGSECIGRSGAVDRRAREAGNINQSLLTLGRVITALVEKAPHVPYRESKLTRLLQDSLGGRTKTSIIATISPAFCNLEETLSTLDYAHRAKNITNKPEINQKLTKRSLIKDYSEQIETLRRDLIAARDKNGFFIDEDNYRTMEDKINFQSEEIKEKLAHIDVLKEELAKIIELFDFNKTELAEKNTALEHTTQSLELKTKDLNKTLNDLKTVRTGYEEQKYLVAHQAKVEKQLGSQASQLLEVANETTDTVGKLHQKINRKNVVETKNKEISNSFQENFHSNISGLEESLSRMFDKHAQYTSVFLEDLEATKKECRDKSAQQINLFANLQDSISKHNNMFLEFSMEGDANIALQYDNLNSSVKTRIDEFLLEQKRFHEESFCKAIARANELAQAQNELFNNLQSSCQTKMQLIQASFNQGIGECFQNLEELSLMAESIGNKNQKSVSQIELETAELKKEQENFLQEYENQLSSLKCFFDKHSQFLDKTIPKISKSANTIRENEEERSKYSQIHHSRVIDSTIKMQETLSGQLLNLEKTIESELNTCCNVNQELQKCHHQTSEQVSENVTKSRTDLTNHLTGILSETKNFNDTIQHNSKRSAEIFKASLSSSTTVVESLISSKATYENTVEDHHDRLSNHASDVASTSEHWKSVLEQELRGQEAIVHRFFSEELLKDLPTGMTPERKTYEYPMSLAATSPHEHILRRLRQDLDSSSAVKIALPLDECELDDTENSQFSNKECSTSLESINSLEASPCNEKGNKLKIEVKENKLRPPKNIKKKTNNRIIQSGAGRGVLAERNMTPSNRDAM